MKKSSILLFLTMILGVIPAFAHEGHGNFHGYEVLHYLTSPLHLLVFMAAIIGAVYIVRVRRSQKR